MTQKTLSVVNDSVVDIPESDYEELRKLFLPYDPEITIERVKEIGAFLLKINGIIYKSKIKETITFKGGGNE